jgi:glutamate-1-semialdehyde 2,1-aminomutase
MDNQSKYGNSAQAYIEACRRLSGGVNSPVRAFGGVDEDPVFIESAAGSKMRDIDGNEYIDYVGSWGPLILGHTHPAVIKAVTSAAQKGASFGAPTQAETILAGKIIDAFDSVAKVRLVSSGTEAVMSAIRLARGYTKKDLIIKMVGCYHGHSDSLLVAAGSGLAEGAIASSPGVPDSIAKLTVIIDYNDIEAVKKAFEVHRDKVAAVLVEPVAANMGVVPPVDGYLSALREVCDKNNSLLIFDEVITGFRVALGGAQQLYGVEADITCLGKIIGGGLPVGAFGGRSEIMDILAPVGPVYQAGTLSGNPLATAAAIATIDILEREGTYEKLEASSSMLEAGLADAARAAGVDVTVNRVGSIMSCFFTDREVRNFADVQSTDIERFKKFFSSMLAEGIYLAPSAYEAMFVSLAHSEQDIKKTVEAAQTSFKEISD